METLQEYEEMEMAVALHQTLIVMFSTLHGSHEMSTDPGCQFFWLRRCCDSSSLHFDLADARGGPYGQQATRQQYLIGKDFCGQTLISVVRVYGIGAIFGYSMAGSSQHYKSIDGADRNSRNFQ
ncbi:hypothetical protein E2562_028845 [Oryza meyeriana var. granulata]|uniref:Uncharacterized protein n=1 Tax=Oryza meyeriana var. granulata TaxID=110450 RepID=A0A6G1FDA7_9ORYZ|nr:hypothetical protein E2562_028845 [Oryza meyeriana var. granulata]